MAINKIFFTENIKTFLINFNFEFKNEEELKLYLSSAYSVFEYYNISEEDFKKGIQKIILTKQRKDLYGRPAPLDLIDMMGLKQKELKLEEIAKSEFYKALEYRNNSFKHSDLSDTSKKLLLKWCDCGSSLWWRLDNFNDNKQDTNWVLKDWVDGWFAIHDEPYVTIEINRNRVIENNKPQNTATLINNIVNNIKIKK